LVAPLMYLSLLASGLETRCAWFCAQGSLSKELRV
jgi:hypothetical protein